MFYRAVQVARQRLDAAVCCGTSAVYRRAALEPQGGPTLIPYAEDVHTGLDVRRAGWSMVYLPVLLSTGICPDNLDAFVRQQYRWCSGNVGIVFSWRLWSIPMRLPARLAYISGFFYYAYTAMVTFFGPVIPIVMLAFLPGQVRLRNFVVLLPAMFTGFVLYPLVAPVQVRAGDLAAGHRPRLGARVRHLGRRLGQVDELASDPDAGQLAAAVPDRDQLVERQRGRALVGPGPLADCDAAAPRSSRSCCSSACSTWPSWPA